MAIGAGETGTDAEVTEGKSFGACPAGTGLLQVRYSLIPAKSGRGRFAPCVSLSRPWLLGRLWPWRRTGVVQAALQEGRGALRFAGAVAGWSRYGLPGLGAIAMGLAGPLAGVLGGVDASP